MSVINVYRDASDTVYEYDILDENGDIFLTGGEFETYEEAIEWLRDLHDNLSVGLINCNKEFDKDINK